MSRARFVPVVVGLVLAVAAALQLGAPRSHAAVSSTIDAWVHEDDSIGMSFADGTPIGSQAAQPPTIPPGTYTINVVDDADIHNFDLTGPGVSMSTDIGGTAKTTWTVTFQPGSTYRFQCDEHPDFMWGAFQTSGTSTSGSTGSTGGSTSGSSGGTTSGSTGSTSSGGTTISIAGTLAATISASGAPKLSLRGKAVKTLPAGRYKLTTTRKLFLQRAGHARIAIAHSATVTLVTGRWSLFVAAGKPKTTVVVT